MKDFNSTQAASPPLHNKINLKSDFYEGGKSLREKVINQSNLLKMQFYNQLDFPKKDEIVKQIRKRSNRILSFSMVSDDVQSELLDKQIISQSQDKYHQKENEFMKYNPQDIQKVNPNNKAKTENTRCKSNLKQNHHNLSQLKNQLSNQQSTSQFNVEKQYNQLSIEKQQNDKSKLDQFSNRDGVEKNNNNNNNLKIDLNEDRMIRKRSSVFLPKFDSAQATPFEYKRITSQNASLIYQNKVKRREKFVNDKSDIQKVGNMYIHNTDFSQQKLPKFKDSFAELVQNHYRNNSNHLSSHRNKGEGNNTQQDQDQNIGGYNNIHRNEQNDSEHQQKRISQSDRKLAVIRILRSKNRTRQQSLPATDLLIQNTLDNSYNQQQLQVNDSSFVKGLNKSIESNYRLQSQVPFSQRQSLDFGRQDGNRIIRNNGNINEKSSLSRLLMQQQSLKLQEIRVHSQIQFEQVPPTPVKSIYQAHIHTQKRRVLSQQSRHNLHPLEQIPPGNQSLIIKKTSDQYIYPSAEANSSSQQISPSRRQNNSPSYIQIYKNMNNKEDDIFKNCQQFMNQLFKKNASLRKKKAKMSSNKESPKNLSEPCSRYKSSNQKTQDHNYLMDIRSIEKDQEEKTNNDYEQLQKYYDGKYLQSAKPTLSNSQNDFKYSNPSKIENLAEKCQYSQMNEEFLSSSQKKITNNKTRKNKSIIKKKQQFSDIQPWNEEEQDKTSLSFFHKTIFDPQNIIIINKSPN